MDPLDLTELNIKEANESVVKFVGATFSEFLQLILLLMVL
jgi:hypothetical protein